MVIEAHWLLPPELMEPAWQVYREAFEELRFRAVQRHLMLRGEFDDQMRDARIRKYVVRAPENGRLLALATLTNDLDAMPLVSPDYFEHRWPALYAERRIWYCGFYAIHPEHQGSATFVRLVTEMRAIIVPGIAVMDFCGRNEEVRRMPQVVRTILARQGDVRPERLDAQAYWSYEFPAAS